MSDTSVDVVEHQANEDALRKSVPAETRDKVEEQEEEEEDEDDETCGFCLFMKGGGCKKEFVAWSECVDRGREEDMDFVSKCHEQTKALQLCMQRNRDYYADFLSEEEDLQASVGPERDEEGVPATASNNASPGGSMPANGVPSEDVPSATRAEDPTALPHEVPLKVLPTSMRSAEIREA